MNETTILVNGEEVAIRFGMWVNEQMIEKGYELSNIGELLQKNPFKFYPIVFHLAACNAKNMDLSDYELKDIYKAIDSIGFMSAEFMKINNLFMNSLGAGMTLPSDTVDVKEKVQKGTKKKP